MAVKDIAVIGMSCNFSHSENINEFWANLRNGREMIHFYSDEELYSLNMHESLVEDSSYVKVVSILKNKESFDYRFFGYTKDEAAIMDPQIRLFHEYVWKALEDAGCDPYSYPGKIGLFAGASDNINWATHTIMKGNGSNVDPLFSGLISNRNYLSSLVSYRLNLRGPSYFLDTACSTSLVAVHVAVRNLLLKECTIAVAGGVKVTSTKTTGYQYEEGMISSRDGHCRTFDIDASGTMSTEGLGIVVLKRLQEAISDGDQIYAVIKSSVTNNDGGRKVGFTAPSVAGQSECIKMAHEIADVSPDSISYVEAHGTATRLGDPIEVEALNLAFGNNKRKHCAIGSVKSNLGHVDTAAGIAGLIKTILALHYKEIPPSLHFKQANPEINFDDGPFYVNTALKTWGDGDNRPLRAGVSSFGLGGTNGHVVLEETPALESTSPGRPYHLFVFSAGTKNSLLRQINEFITSFDGASEPPEDVAYTLTRRAKLRFRASLVCESYPDAIDKLRKPAVNEVEKRPLVVFMFSGQGSQYLNMGKALYENEPYFREIMDYGFGFLARITGDDYKEIVFNDEITNGRGSINETKYTQPILFVFEYALAKLLIQWGVKPDFVIGHSIGELAAACISGVFSFDDGLIIVNERARMMSSMNGGAMLGVELPYPSVASYLENGLSVAAINMPNYCVVSGARDDIEGFAKNMSQKGVHTREIIVSHAFHSSLMDPMVKQFEEKVGKINLSNPNVPFISNITGKKVTGELTQAGYWARHARETVRFSDGIATIIEENVKTLFIEIGPGNALTNFCKRISQGNPNQPVVLNLVRHPMEKSDDRRLLADRLGQLWLHGIDIKWQEYYKGHIRRVVSLPTYCFEVNRLPTIVDPVPAIRESVLSDSRAAKNSIAEWFYLPNWKRAILLNVESSRYKWDNYLIFSDGSEFAFKLISYLVSKGHRVFEVLEGDHFAISSVGFDPEQIIYVWTPGKSRSNSPDASPGVPNGHFFSLLNFCKAFKVDEVTDDKKLFVITAGMQTVFEDEEGMNSGASAVLGILKVLPQENPHFFCCNVDVLPYEDQDRLVAGIYDEIRCNSNDPIVALRRGARWIEYYQKLHVDEYERNSIIKDGGVYLITGGLGVAGIHLAEYLLQKYASRVILVGLTDISVQRDPNVVPGDAVLDKKISGKIDGFNRLRRSSDRVEYVNADISDYNLFFDLVRNIEDRVGKIDGVIHTAGNLEPGNFKAVEKMNAADVDAHFGAKVGGLMNLYKIFKDRRPDFVWITSSLAAVLGGLTYTAYAAANISMDYFIRFIRRHMDNWLSVDLDALTLNSLNTNDYGITGKEFIQVFERSFQLMSYPNVIVSTTELDYRVEKYVRRKVSEQTPQADLFTNYEQPAARGRADTNGSSIEDRVCRVWQDFFGVDQIGIDLDFFEMGGDSLKAMTLSKRIYKEFGVDLPIKTFFLNSNIRLLSNEISLAIGLKAMGEQKHSDKILNEVII
jgi:phthiocerol/phenolphthiocerol synthesis type-I polyketide synthase E